MLKPNTVFEHWTWFYPIYEWKLHDDVFKGVSVINNGKQNEYTGHTKEYWSKIKDALWFCIKKKCEFRFEFKSKSEPGKGVTGVKAERRSFLLNGNLSVACFLNLIYTLDLVDHSPEITPCITSWPLLNTSAVPLRHIYLFFFKLYCNTVFELYIQSNSCLVVMISYFNICSG